jgi:hypothetical protein
MSHELNSVGRTFHVKCRDQGSNPSMPTYLPLRGENLATRLPDKKI